MSFPWWANEMETAGKMGDLRFSRLEGGLASFPLGGVPTQEPGIQMSCVSPVGFRHHRLVANVLK